MRARTSASNACGSTLFILAVTIGAVHHRGALAAAIRAAEPRRFFCPEPANAMFGCVV